jgi:hypothetical protein
LPRWQFEPKIHRALTVRLRATLKVALSVALIEFESNQPQLRVEDGVPTITAATVTLGSTCPRWQPDRRLSAQDMPSINLMSNA